MSRYDSAQRDYFNKETDYVIHTKYGQTRIAGLFKWRKSYDVEPEYEWVTAEGMQIIPDEDIVYYSSIRF